MPESDHHRTPTVSEAVRDASALIDPGDNDDAIMALYEIYEDDDRPVTAVEEQAATEVPAGRLGTPEEYGDLVAFLCSARAAYLTGAVIPLDGGLLKSS